jgi:epoxyqueuosine reductase
MIEISKRENFYQQEYCGCVYSLRDTNRHRVETGRERIRLGEVYYGQEQACAVLGEKADERVDKST